MPLWQLPGLAVASLAEVREFPHRLFGSTIDREKIAVRPEEMSDSYKNCRYCEALAHLEANFCSNCGSSLADAAGQEDHTDQRLLTIMFCDMVGSTPLARFLDPKDYEELLGNYHHICATGVHEMGGYVQSYMGDGVLCYFGYPIAHEDSVLRAAHAGLNILNGMAELRSEPESVNFNMHARIGLHTGRVLMSENCMGPRNEPLAIGSTTNYAARLQGSAEPDTLVCSGSTFTLMQGQVEARRLPSVALKGINEQVSRYEITGIVETHLPKPQPRPRFA